MEIKRNQLFCASLILLLPLVRAFYDFEVEGEWSEEGKQLTLTCKQEELILPISYIDLHFPEASQPWEEITLKECKSLYLLFLSKEIKSLTKLNIVDVTDLYLHSSFSFSTITMTNVTRWHSGENFSQSFINNLILMYINNCFHTPSERSMELILHLEQGVIEINDSYVSNWKLIAEEVHLRDNNVEGFFVAGQRHTLIGNNFTSGRFDYYLNITFINNTFTNVTFTHELAEADVTFIGNIIKGQSDNFIDILMKSPKNVIKNNAMECNEHVGIIHMLIAIASAKGHEEYKNFINNNNCLENNKPLYKWLESSLKTYPDYSVLSNVPHLKLSSYEWKYIAKRVNVGFLNIGKVELNKTSIAYYSNVTFQDIGSLNGPEIYSEEIDNVVLRNIVEFKGSKVNLKSRGLVEINNITFIDLDEINIIASKLIITNCIFMKNFMILAVADNFTFTGNEVQAIHSRSFVIEAATLDMRKNNFGELQENAFSNVTSKRSSKTHLVFSENRIEHLQPNSLEFIPQRPKLPFAVLNISNNTITCNCRNLEFFESLQHSTSTRERILFDSIKDENYCTNKKCKIRSVTNNIHMICSQIELKDDCLQDHDAQMSLDKLHTALSKGNEEISRQKHDSKMDELLEKMYKILLVKSRDSGSVNTTEFSKSPQMETSFFPNWFTILLIVGVCITCGYFAFKKIRTWRVSKMMTAESRKRLSSSEFGNSVSLEQNYE